MPHNSVYSDLQKPEQSFNIIPAGLTGLQSGSESHICPQPCFSPITPYFSIKTNQSLTEHSGKGCIWVCSSYKALCISRPCPRVRSCPVVQEHKDESISQSGESSQLHKRPAGVMRAGDSSSSPLAQITESAPALCSLTPMLFFSSCSRVLSGVDLFSSLFTLFPHSPFSVFALRLDLFKGAESHLCGNDKRCGVEMWACRWLMMQADAADALHC